MADDEPITQLLAGLKCNDEKAIERLWRLYIRRVAGLARKTLAPDSRAQADEEDVAQSAFRSFCLRARDDKFDRLNDRHDLWNLLGTITFRKALRRLKQQSRHPWAAGGLEFAISPAPDHELAVMLQDEIGHLMGLLDTDAGRVGWLLLDGCTNAEIAQRCGFSLAKVERKRRLIRETWRREMEP